MLYCIYSKTVENILSFGEQSTADLCENWQPAPPCISLISCRSKHWKQLQTYLPKATTSFVSFL